MEKRDEELNEEQDALDEQQETDAVQENVETEAAEAGSSEDAPEAVEDSAEDLLKKVQEAAKASEDKFLRTLAEFDNFRKRTVSEKRAMYDNGVKDTVEKFLAVTDNFERAVVYSSEEEKSTALYKGVEMIFDQFNEILGNLGIKEVAGVGETFDPNVHNAVMHIEDESLGENVVAEVLQKGYTYNDKVIRPAMVKVAN